MRKRKKVKQSDWRTYCGSSTELKIAVIRNGEAAYRFEIMAFVDRQWMLSYVELWFQMREGVLFDPMSFNGIVNVRLAKFPGAAPCWEKFKSDYPQYFKNP